MKLTRRRMSVEAPISERLAAILHALWDESADAERLRLSQGATIELHAAKIAHREDRGGTPPPRVSSVVR